MRRRVLVLLLAVIAACTPATEGSPFPPDPSSAPASAAPSSPASVAPSADASAAGLPIIDMGACCLGTELEPGTYRSPHVWTFGISLAVPEGWRVFRTDVANGGVVALVRGDANAIGHATEYLAFFPIPADTLAETFVEDLRATSYLIPGASEEAIIDGNPAVTFDATSEPNPDATGDEDAVAGALDFTAINEIIAPHRWRSETAGASFRFTVVEGPSGGLLIYQEAPPDLFDSLAADAQPVIDSVSFFDP
jgi:hypothetical protein